MLFGARRHRQHAVSRPVFRYGAPRVELGARVMVVDDAVAFFPHETSFEEQMRLNRFDYLHASEHAQASLAEQYVGLPFED